MTATVTEPAPAPARSRTWVPAFRILRTEIRHSAFVWCLPLLIALFVFDPYRTASSYAPLWPLRSTVVLNKFWPDMVVFAAGFSAWAGSREGRRDVGDLLGTTARAAWTRQLLSFAGTAFWVVATFLAGVAAIYVRTAMVATWGGPPVAPVVVGAVGMIMVCAVGFALGALVPGRFTAPIVAVALMVITLVAFRQSVGSTGGAVAVLSPDGGVPGNDWGVFYATPAGVPVTQCLFTGGVALAALGLLGLAPRTGGVGWRGTLPAVTAGGARLRTVALSVFAVGVAALVAGAALASTSTGSPDTGYRIPVIDGTTATTIAYTPVCSTGSFRVCAHPAYRDFLPHMASAIAAAADEVTGLPGAPVRAAQVARTSLPATDSGGGTGYGRVTSGGVCEFSMDSELFGGPDSTNYQQGLQFDILNAVIVGPGQATQGVTGNEAQGAVLLGLGKDLGWTPSSLGASQEPPAAVTTAAARFAALPAATRHAWLVTHLAALKAGTMTVEQVP
jgi:hypothetical protein